MAVEPRATATVFLADRSARPGPHLAQQPGEIVAHSGGGTERIYPDAGHHLAEAVIAHAVGPSHTSPVSADTPSPQWRIEIDTTTFFDARSGAKQGLGSSAAAAVLLTTALFQLGDRDPVFLKEDVASTAIAAHRAANGGRGSGYDIVTSTLGGVVRFVGGAHPQWQPSGCARQWTGHALRLFSWFSGTSVASSHAVSRFNQYVPEGSPERTAFIARNNAVVDRIEGATTWDALFEAVSDSRRLGEEIGAAVGVPATIDICQPHRDDGWVVKASGAGNERAVILAQPNPRRSVPRQASVLPVSTEGLRWEYGSGEAGHGVAGPGVAGPGGAGPAP